MNTDPRGQANLVSLSLALLVVTATAGIAVVVAEGALEGAQRTPEQRRVAVALSERLVSADRLTTRDNVLDARTVRTLNASVLRAAFPVTRGSDVRVTLRGRRLARTGDLDGGTTVRRVVLVRTRRSVTVEPRVSPGENVTLPRRTPRVRLSIDPPTGVEVQTVRANGRVVLHDRGGLRGNFSVRVSRFETTSLRFDADRTLPTGSVQVTYFPGRTTKAVLEVTVDARSR